MGNSNSNTDSSSNALESKQANKMIKKGYFDMILDVRSDQEYLQGYYPNSTHIPSDKVEKKFCKKYSNKDIKVLVHCASGYRAGNVVKILKSQGYTNVYSLKNCGYEELIR